MKVVTFGELMVRLQTFSTTSISFRPTAEFTFGGGRARCCFSGQLRSDATFVASCPHTQSVRPLSTACALRR